MTRYEKHRYLLMSKDAVHIGTGGYRLGRVDNSIVREPGNRVPKIPGTSLHGAIRAYAARIFENPAAAGQTHDDVPNPDADPICYTFGYIRAGNPNANEAAKAYSGVVNIFDALILLFPVHSLHGPVWVTTKTRLTDAGISVTGIPENWPNDEILTTWEQTDPLNLGWLMLNPMRTQATITPPEAWNTDTWNQVANRIVIVQDVLFSQIVNSNLEVRTSVSIDPETGAAKDGALFTYEAMPRTTFLTGEIILDDYREGTTNIFTNPITQTQNGGDLSGPAWEGPMDVVSSGLRLIEWLGVGGMGTRGFGRLSLVGDAICTTFDQEVTN